MNNATIKFEEFGFNVNGVSCGLLDGAFVYNYKYDVITAIYLDGVVKKNNRWRSERTEMHKNHPLYNVLESALLTQCERDIDYATPDHIQARNQRNQDALRTISLAGVRTC